MATQKKKSAFEILSSIDVSGHTEQKGRFTYLSWAWAVSVLLKHFPEATWEIHEWGLEETDSPIVSHRQVHLFRLLSLLMVFLGHRFIQFWIIRMKPFMSLTAFKLTLQS